MADKKHFDFLRVLSTTTKKYCDIQLTEQQAGILRRVFDDPIAAEKSWQNDPGSWIENMFGSFCDAVQRGEAPTPNDALCFLVPPERGFRPYVNKKKK